MQSGRTEAVDLLGREREERRMAGANAADVGEGEGSDSPQIWVEVTGRCPHSLWGTCFCPDCCPLPTGRR